MNWTPYFRQIYRTIVSVLMEEDMNDESQEIIFNGKKGDRNG